MKEPQKIVVGVDFSPESEVAARQALEIARHTGAELILVHAGTTVEMPTLSADASESAHRAVDFYRQHLVERLTEVRRDLGEMRERLSGQGPVVSQLVVEDFPADGLCAIAKDLRARLTVVGTHGRTGLRWLWLGSVAQAVVRHSDSDVLVVRPPRSPHAGFRRILVATDFSASAARALDSALELAAPGATIDVVYCATPPPTSYSGFGALQPLPADLRQALIDDLHRQGEEPLKSRRIPGMDLRFHVLSAAPRLGIAHRLETFPYDLVALGSHGRRGIRRALMGSVAEAVVQRAPCSVLVARTPAKSSK